MSLNILSDSHFLSGRDMTYDVVSDGYTTEHNERKCPLYGAPTKKLDLTPESRAVNTSHHEHFLNCLNMTRNVTY